MCVFAQARLTNVLESSSLVLTKRQVCVAGASVSLQGFRPSTGRGDELRQDVRAGNVRALPKRCGAHAPLTDVHSSARHARACKITSQSFKFFARKRDLSRSFSAFHVRKGPVNSHFFKTFGGLKEIKHKGGVKNRRGVGGGVQQQRLRDRWPLLVFASSAGVYILQMS